MILRAMPDSSKEPTVRIRADLDAIDLRILAELQADGRVTNEQVRSRTGLDRGQVLALLSRLVEKGRIMKHGERRGTYYTAADPK